MTDELKQLVEAAEKTADEMEAFAHKTTGLQADLLYHPYLAVTEGFRKFAASLRAIIERG